MIRHAFLRRNTLVVTDAILIVAQEPDGSQKVLLMKPNNENPREAVLQLTSNVINTIAHVLEVPREGLLNMLRHTDPQEMNTLYQESLS